MATVTCVVIIFVLYAGCCFNVQVVCVWVLLGIDYRPRHCHICSRRQNWGLNSRCIQTLVLWAVILPADIPSLRRKCYLCLHWWRTTPVRPRVWRHVSLKPYTHLFFHSVCWILLYPYADQILSKFSELQRVWRCYSVGAIYWTALR